MNIFYLDKDPAIAAQYHCDKHVIKMILESAQLLCTAINYHAGEQVTPYKSTHINHPCSIWCRHSYRNWSYVFQLMCCLEQEWQYRHEHSKQHKSINILCDNGVLELASKHIPTNSRTEPPLAMPDHCKISGNVVESYRKYYREEKAHLHSWIKRGAPSWL